MVLQLKQGRNDLDKYIEFGTPLEELLVEGRFLESDWHDTGAPKAENGCRIHMHWYRKILKTYDSEKDAVLLSEKGSRRLIGNLDKPDKEYTKQELYGESVIMNWKVREKDCKLY
ncbi:MAG: hypothetical protein WC584_03590 [Candidatus Pacearchaeota archaeon]